MSQERLNALAMLSIEKELVKPIPKFNEMVIDRFVSKKDRRIDFLQEVHLVFVKDPINLLIT